MADEVVGQEASTDHETQRDQPEAEWQSAVVATGDLQNDVDMKNAAAAAEDLWDSGDRRATLAEFLTERGRDHGYRAGRSRRRAGSRRQ